MEKNFLSLRPVQGRQGGLYDSRFRARHDAPPTVVKPLRHPYMGLWLNIICQ